MRRVWWVVIFGVLAVQSGCLADADSATGSFDYPTVGLSGVPNLLSPLKTDYSNAPESANGPTCLLEFDAPYCTQRDVTLEAIVPDGGQVRVEMRFLTPFTGSLEGACQNATACAGSESDPEACLMRVKSAAENGEPTPADCGDCFDCLLELDKTWRFSGAGWIGSWNIDSGNTLYETRVQNVTSEASGQLNIPVILRNSGSAEIRVFENKASEPALTKVITW